MKFFKHCRWAIKYGEWDIGWELYKGKPMFGFFTGYYDGHYASFHLWKFWIGVCY